MARPEPATEPRAPLSKERVLHAAVTLAARDGIESVTMRKLADELGAGAMSLYHYVPNKEELLDGMIDIVFSEIEPPSTDDDWKTAMRKRAISTREALGRHVERPVRAVVGALSEADPRRHGELSVEARQRLGIGRRQHNLQDPHSEGSSCSSSTTGANRSP